MNIQSVQTFTKLFFKAGGVVRKKQNLAKQALSYYAWKIAISQQLIHSNGMCRKNAYVDTEQGMNRGIWAQFFGSMKIRAFLRNTAVKLQKFVKGPRLGQGSCLKKGEEYRSIEISALQENQWSGLPNICLLAPSLDTVTGQWKKDTTKGRFITFLSLDQTLLFSKVDFTACELQVLTTNRITYS